MKPEELTEFRDYILQSLAQGVHGASLDIFNKDELSLNVPLKNLLQVLLFLRDDPRCQFKVLTDICGVDFLDREQRFEVIYNLLSIKFNSRIRVKINCTEDDLVPSATAVFSAARWYEREVWDMYGVMFSGHPDLRRILTDYGFEGHPQRKDFPLTGYVEVKYDNALGRVVYDEVSLPQEYRNFDFVSPWEGTIYVAGEVIQGRKGGAK